MKKVTIALVFILCAVRITKSSAFHTIGSHLLVSSKIIFMDFNQHYFYNKRDQSRMMILQKRTIR